MVLLGRAGVSLAMRHRLCDISTSGLKGLREEGGMSTPPTAYVDCSLCADRTIEIKQHNKTNSVSSRRIVSAVAQYAKNTETFRQ